MSEYTEESIKERHGEPSLIVKPSESLPSDTMLINDIPDEYRIYLKELDNVSGACIVFGRYGGTWRSNPSLRFLVNELTQRVISTESK
jgi:hypothetical protein